MSEPALPLWNRDNSDVLPQYRLTFGHTIFRGVNSDNWQFKLLKVIGLEKPVYSGPLNEAAIPRHAPEQCLVLGSATETHFVFARLGDVWNVFGAHDHFFASRKWMEFNAKAGGLMAFGTQMDEDSFSYLVFNRGIKQTNAFTEGKRIRIFQDSRVDGYIGNEKVFEDKPICGLSDTDVRDFIEHTLALRVCADGLSIIPRFTDTTAPIKDVMHVIFQRSLLKKSFLGFRLS